MKPDLAAQQWRMQFRHLGWCTGMIARLRRHADQINGDRLSGEQPEMTGRAAITQQHQSPRAWELTRPLSAQHGCGGRLPEMLRGGKKGVGGSQWIPPTARLRRRPSRAITAPFSLTDSRTQPLDPMASPIPLDSELLPN